MQRQAGVWIDHRKAVVVVLEDGEPRVKTVESHTEKPTKTSGGSHQKEPWGHQDVVAEDHRKHDYQRELGHYYQAVAAELASADKLLILGSGQAHKEFRHYLEDKQHYRGTIREDRPAMAMADEEVIEEVRRFFGC